MPLKSWTGAGWPLEKKSAGTDSRTVRRSLAPIDDIELPQDYQGLPPISVPYGYTVGGYDGTFSVIGSAERFPSASFTTATAWGDLNISAPISGIIQSSAYSKDGTGYIAGGYGGGTGGARSEIQSYSLASELTSATAHGDLGYLSQGGAPAQSETHGYVAGGDKVPAPGQPQAASTTITKFTFVSPSVISSVGDLNVATPFSGNAGNSSSTHGYSSSTFVTPNTSEKYPFAADTPATTVGGILLTGPAGTSNRNALQRASNGVSSSTDGYIVGGYNPGASGFVNKFTFASDTDSQYVGELSHKRGAVATHGFADKAVMSGGYGAESVPLEPAAPFGVAFGAGSGTVIDEFPFAADNFIATDTGDLNTERYYAIGHVG